MAAKAIQYPSLLTGTRRLFYAVTPNETSFATVEEVPNYIQEASPLFTALVILEMLTNLIGGRKKTRCNDGLASITAGVFSELPGLFIRNLNIGAYIWIYQYINIVALPWDHSATWWLAVIGFDFCFYWYHRILHEVNVLWSGHQIHHSAEDYNLTTFLRQSCYEKAFQSLVFWPMAFFIPPSVYLTHLQINLLYQFWIHTQVIRKMPAPIEYIFNTPSHHRVHHGRNPYCIDKNFGGTLIIWDRIFGTYQDETEEVAYGLVHPSSTWNPFYIQFGHLKYMWDRFWEEQGIANKLSVFVKGPGWRAGKPRLGDPADIPTVETPIQRYNKGLSEWYSIYLIVHTFIIVIAYQEVLLHKEVLSTASLVLFLLFTVASLTTFAGLNDHKEWALYAEFLRCAVYLLAEGYIVRGQAYGGERTIIRQCVQLFYVFSACLAGLQLTAKSPTIFEDHKASFFNQ